MSVKRCTSLVGGLLILVGSLAATAPIVSANEELMKLQKDDAQWASQNKNYSGTRYSTLNQLTPENVKNLKVAWSFSLGTLNGQQGGPLVVGDTMYVHSSYSTGNSHNIFALDLSKEGAPIKWKYVAKHDPKAVPVACCDLVHKGLQYGNGKILYQTLDGMVIALDAKTGKELWKTRNADPSKGETNTAAGLVIKDKYIAGVAGGEFGVRGWVAAYDINTGKQVWKAYSTGPDEALKLASDFNAANPHYGRFGEGTKSWPGEEWKTGGGTTWGYYSYDPDLNLLYYGSGNPGTWNPAPRKGGDNKWSMTLWARNPDTGVAKWAYQMTPWDNWDYDGIDESVLTEQTIDGKKRKVLTHFDRNGFVYTLDRADGTLLKADAFVYVNWAKGIDLKTGRPIVNEDKLTKQGEDTKNICPCAMGGKNYLPVAYSPQTNLFYASVNNMCMDYEGVKVQYTAGAPYVGATVLMFEGHEGKDKGWWGDLIAWDVVKGKRAWAIKESQPPWSGPVVTSTNVVFYGTMDGWFKAVDARDGKLLWKHKVGSGIIGNPMTYKGPDGKQYVAVYSGVGGWFGATVSLDLPSDDPTAALGGVNAAYLSGLPMATTKGGTLYVFGL